MSDRTATARVLVLAPHPDDESLAVGGLLQRLIARGAEVQVVFTTDGENNPWAQRAVERRWRIGPTERERWRALRRGEALAALERLGVPGSQVRFLSWPDQGITRMLLVDHTRALHTLRDLIHSLQPTLIIAPALEDLHPDHSALAVLVHEALDRETSPPRLLTFVVHAPAGHECHGPAVRLTVNELEHKRNAILCHTSQLFWRRRGLLAYATAEERFAGGHRSALLSESIASQADGGSAPGINGDSGSDTSTVEHHPITRARMECDALVLDLAPRSRVGAWGPLELLVAARWTDRRDGWSIRLPRTRASAAIQRCADRARIGSAAVGRVSGRLRVAIPRRVIAGATAVYAKLERRFGFFDESGWQLVAREPSATHELAADVMAALEPVASLDDR